MYKTTQPTTKVIIVSPLPTGGPGAARREGRVLLDERGERRLNVRCRTAADKGGQQ